MSLVQEREMRKLRRFWPGSHGIILMRLNDPNARLPYYFIRKQKNSMGAMVKHVRSMHPNSVMIFQCNHVQWWPAGYLNTLFENHSKLKFKFEWNYCDANVPESELIDILGKLCLVNFDDLYFNKVKK
jgi:Protein of unknown function (DUF3627)